VTVWKEEIPKGEKSNFRYSAYPKQEEAMSLTKEEK